jgi:hypothetical protein
MLSAENIPVSEGLARAKASAKVTPAADGYRLQVDDPRDEAGLVLDGPWDLSKWKFLAVDVENLSSDVQLRLLMQVNVDSEEKKHRETNLGIALNPGEKRTLRVKLPHQWRYASPEGVPGVRTIDTTKVKSIAFYMQWPFERAQAGLLDCRLTNLRGEEALTPGTPLTAEQYVPFIDEYGQFIHDEWPTKVHSVGDIKKQHAAELAELAESTRPEQWNRFGGWANGPQLQATGNFRVEKYQGKWYFVDPDGKLFFSHGIDVISRYNDPLKVMPGHEDWFKSPPEGDKFFPTEGILREKYGTEEYLPEYFQVVAKRLPHWGMNTIGNWSALGLMERGDMPYTLQLTDFNWRMPLIKGSKLKMYDVFDPRYVERMKTLISSQATEGSLVLKSLTDPMCIGYFIDNEINFGNREELAYVKDVFKSPKDQVAKQEFINGLKKKYSDISKLNLAWKTEYGSWNALLEAEDVPKGRGYKRDGEAFFERTVDQYFRLAREAVKSQAPHRLYLGCRFVGTDSVRPVLYKATAKYCDVLTVNIYAHSVANFPVQDYPDMPVLIGEFHFGILDRGMLHPSLCQAGASPEDRALAYTRFVQGALVHPNIVGTHWFQYRDQPLTGRGDGEAYQLGFVDVTDVPYKELCEAARKVGENLYTYRTAGKLANSMSGE